MWGQGVHSIYIWKFLALHQVYAGCCYITVNKLDCLPLKNHHLGWKLDTVMFTAVRCSSGCSQRNISMFGEGRSPYSPVSGKIIVTELLVTELKLKYSGLNTLSDCHLTCIQVWRSFARAEELPQSGQHASMRRDRAKVLTLSGVIPLESGLLATLATWDSCSLLAGHFATLYRIGKRAVTHGSA